MAKKATNDQLIESYSRLKNVWHVAKEFGMCGQSVHERMVKLGIELQNPKWSVADKFMLKEHYMNYLLEGKLDDLAVRMGRTKEFICRQAGKLGLTDISRKKKLLSNWVPSNPDWANNPNGHPKGMKGKAHSQETKDRLHITSTASQKIISEDVDRRAAIILKTMKTKYEKGSMVQPRPKATWKAGWRNIGGKEKYFRSRWEANYARYLQWLKDQKQIIEWEHEPEVFWFDGIKRGCVSYLPDFRITELNEKYVYHEVKGWMDDRSKTKIRRMAIYHPTVTLKIIDAKWFKENNRNLTSIIYGWET